MATAIQRRRGTSTQHGSFTGLAGEITIDTTNNTVVVHDGSTAGGHRLAKYTEITALGEGDITGIVAGAGLTGDATSGDATLAVGAGTGITVNANDVAINTTTVRGLFSATGDLTYNSGTGAFSFTNDAGDIESVVAGAGLTGGGTSGDVTVNVIGGDGITVAADEITTDDTYIKALFSAGGDLSYSNGVFSFTNDAGDIESVVAGSGLTGGGTSGDVTLNVIGGDGITANANDMAVDSTVVRTTGTQTIAGAKTFSNDAIFSGNLTVSGTQTTINTETLTVDDNIIVLNNNESGTPSQDAGIEVERGTSTNVKLQFDEGDDKWQFTNDGSAYNDLLTVTQVEALFSVTDAGGDGSMSYNNTSGVFTYTGPSAAEARAHISASGDLAYNSSTGVVSFTERTDAEVRGLISAGGDLAYNSSTGVISFTNDAGDIEGVTAGSGITGGGTSGTVTVALDYENLTGNLVPSSNNTYSLGTATNMWKDVYVGPGSLYVNGQKVIEDDSGTIQVSADANQNLSLLTSGTGDIELTSGGDIQLKTDVVLSADKTITSSGGVKFASNVNMNSNNINNLDDPVVAQDAATKAYVDTTVAASGDILGVTAGDGLSGGGTTGTVSLALDLNELTAAAVDVTADSIALIDGSDNSSKKESISDLVSAIAGTGITATSGVLSLTDTGYVTGVTAGDGLSGGGTEGTVTLALDFNELTSAAVDVSADSIVMVDGTDNSSKKETIADLATAMAGTNITASSGQLVGTAGTVTSVGGGAGLTGTVTSSGSLAVGQGSGITVNADDVAVDSTVVRTTGTQSIGGGKTFEDIIISGNLTVNGTTTQVNTETLTVDDNIIVLNNNESGTPSEDAGIEVERGTSTNVKLQWDESADVWQFTNDGSTYYSVPTTANIRTSMGVSDAGGLGSFTYTSGTGVYEYTGPSNADITGLISVTDAGGLGSLAYSSGEITYTGPADADITGLISVTDAGGDGSLSYNAGVITYTGPSAAETRAHLSAVTSGDGSLSYSSSTGAFTYTGPSASETRAHFSGGTSITLSSGEISVTAGSIGATQLAATAVTSGTYGDADSVAQFTVDADGRITSASNIDISIVAGDVSGLSASATTDTTSASNISSGTLASARLPDLAVSDFAGAAVQTSGESFANNDTSFMTSASIEDKILSYGYSTTTGDILGVTAGTGLSGGGTSGTVTLNVGGLTVSELASGSLQISSESFADNDTTLMTSAAIQDKILSYGYTTTTGDITGVTASTGLSGGGSSGGVSLSVDLGDTGTFTSTNTASKAVVRDGSGNFAAGTITATATQAQYADLAEKYESDAEYEPGTVVVFGGDKEITACSSQGSHAVVGVISTDPAYMMNSEAEGQYVALTGRVPCKVTGPVAKGDLLVTSGEEGHAEVQNEARPGTIIGKAIGTNPEGNGPAIIEVLVSLM